MKKIKQHEVVIAALARLGGASPLANLYLEVFRQPTNWGTKTPHATVRRIVQKRPEFYKLRPGLYCLASRRAEFEAQYALPSRGEAPAAAVHNNHYFYQGMLLEIGDARGMDTYVPPQDKNRAYLGKRLCQISVIAQLPEFGYPRFMKKARTIDVVWLNERKMPAYFFEVEMQGNFSNSLLKFDELQDFSAEMNIVAPESYRRRFMREINLNAFRSVRKRVKFYEIEKLAAHHERALLGKALA